MGRKLRSQYPGAIYHVMNRGSKQQGIPETALAQWRKGHPFKIRLAARPRAETAVTVDWIAQGLAMGTRGHLAYLLKRTGQAPPPATQALQTNLPI